MATATKNRDKARIALLQRLASIIEGVASISSDVAGNQEAADLTEDFNYLIESLGKARGIAETLNS